MDHSRVRIVTRTILWKTQIKNENKQVRSCSGNSEFFKIFARNFPELSYAIIGEFLGHRVLIEGVSMINILEIVKYFLEHIELAKLINYKEKDENIFSFKFIDTFDRARVSIRKIHLF